jgi:hypothetical protein
VQQLLASIAQQGLMVQFDDGLVRPYLNACGHDDGDGCGGEP